MKYARDSTVPFKFEYRQIIAKKYRIIYQLAKPNIFVFGIIHGNRNISEVLYRFPY
jgi:hypothetical protein